MTETITITTVETATTTAARLTTTIIIEETKKTGIIETETEGVKTREITRTTGITTATTKKETETKTGITI